VGDLSPDVTDHSLMVRSLVISEAALCLSHHFLGLDGIRLFSSCVSPRSKPLKW
jgi:hypothetical protein